MMLARWTRTVQHQDGALRQRLAQAPQHGEAVLAWHHIVHDDDAGREGLGQAHRRFAVADLADDGDARVVFEQSPQAVAHQGVIVDQENRDRLGSRCARALPKRTVGSSGSFGASPLLQHIGLARVASIVDVEIWWPTSNIRQRFADVTKNQTLQIEELATTYTTLARPPLPLGGSKTSERAPTH
jgi:hypothetical protein